MALIQDEFYHIYNQGNNKGTLFHTHDNYIFFLNKIREYVKPHCEIIAYCLMPNHYHFLIMANEKSIQIKKVGSLDLTALSNGFRIVTSSYAQAVNIQLGSTGALFRPKTKFKSIDNGHRGYLQTAFDYIHQNPLESGLVEDLSYWNYSSYLDYKGLRNGTLCNIKLGKEYVEY